MITVDVNPLDTVDGYSSSLRDATGPADVYNDKYAIDVYVYVHVHVYMYTCTVDKYC